jgi:hypothetical protein
MQGIQWKVLFLALGLFAGNNSAHSQFAPAADLPGTTAIWKDSSAFVAWATGCTVQRGYMNIANPSLGYASAGNDTDAIGKAGVNGTVSLGDGGIATLTFDHPIYNGDGFDFAVFENGFMTNDSNLAFLEYAFVEVSSDGQNFFRFHAVSNNEDTVQFAMQGTDCSLVQNLAGKYIFGYGTPFDLDELKNQAGLDVNNITQVRVIDVVGSIDDAYATRDINGNKINDPWPTPFPSCGFDLDAVGVIHAKGLTDVKSISENPLSVFPNPVKADQDVYVNLPAQAKISVSEISGKVLRSFEREGGLQRLSTSGLAAGVYFISVETSQSRYISKLVIE